MIIFCLDQGVVSATRVQGKEDYFKNLFATAWMKGTADTQVSIYIYTIMYKIYLEFTRLH